MTLKQTTIFLALVVFLLIGCIAIETIMLATAAKEYETAQAIIASQRSLINEISDQRDRAYKKMAEMATEDTPVTLEEATNQTDIVGNEATFQNDFEIDVKVFAKENSAKPQENSEMGISYETVSVNIAPSDAPAGLKSLGTFKVTHYCCCEICCGNTLGITASGRAAVPNYSIAVDKSVIPLGSAVWLDYGDGALVEYRADDTGGAVKGATIDVCCADHATALSLGRRSATVYVQEEAK